MLNQNNTNMETKEISTIERAYNECHEQIYNHALRVVKNVHDAEDVRGNVYLKIQRLECTNYDKNHIKKAQFSSWINTITNSVLLDFFRTNHQEHYQAIADFADNNDESKTYFNFVAPDNYKADAEVLTSELHSRIAKAFRTLKPKYRKIAVLYFLRDLPYVEIAEIVNVPMGTVKGMISRARVKLQAELRNVYNMKAVNVQSVEA